MAKPFSHVFFINLDSRPDRRAHCEAQIAALNLPADIVIHRIPAVRTPENGARGCALSHSLVFKEAIRQEAEAILVLEDDVLFEKPDTAYATVCSLVAELPNDWELLQPDVTCLPCSGGRFASAKQVAVAGWMICTHAYIVSCRAFRIFKTMFKLCAVLQEHDGAPLDIFWNATLLRYGSRWERWFMARPGTGLSATQAFRLFSSDISPARKEQQEAQSLILRMKAYQKRVFFSQSICAQLLKVLDWKVDGAIWSWTNDGALQMRPRFLAALETVFHMFDQDGDGFLCREELTDWCLKANGRPPTSAELDLLLSHEYATPRGLPLGGFLGIYISQGLTNPQ